MMNLYPTKKFRFPITAECISPDVFQDKKIEEIRRLTVWEGNKQRILGELFKVKESESETKMVVINIHGDVSRVRRIGAYMTSGQIVIYGNAGMHLGEEMEGGEIIVRGNVGCWAGSMMKGGKIEIYGNAGNYLGAPYRGVNKGMRGGEIVVHGNVGNEAGAYMRRGVIKVYGNAGQFAGLRMQNGTIYVQKDCEARVGACMKDGKIIVSGFLESVLPTFTIEGLKEKVKIENDETAEGPFYLFLGDTAEDGKGKLYVSKTKNPHLNRYEKFL